MADQNWLQDDEDVEQILRIAISSPDVRRDQSLRDRLTKSAQELGLSPEQVRMAEEKWKVEKELAVDREEFVREQRSGFYGHLAGYIAVNLVLATLALKDGEFWFVFPLLGWGFGILGHARSIFNRKSEAFQKEFNDWRAKRNSSK